MRVGPPEASLASSQAVLVAWAAEDAIAHPERSQHNGPLLVAALHRLAADDAGQRARTHALRALYELKVPIDSKELLQLHVTGMDPLQIAMLVRNASPAGGELFELFQRLDPADDPAWEYVGGALALRGHRTFAIETYTRAVPRIHVLVGQTEKLPEVRPAVPRRPAGDGRDFPDSTTYAWRRSNGLLELRACGAGSPKDPFLSATIDDTTPDLASWRWLATLAGVTAPPLWSRRWILTVPVFLPADLSERLARARERARADAAIIDRGLRERGLLPADFARTLPMPVLVIHDLRSPTLRASKPLPTRLDR